MEAHITWQSTAVSNHHMSNKPWVPPAVAHEPSLPPGGGSQSVLGSIATAVTPFDVAAEGSLRQRAVAVLLGHASKAFGGL